jgi:hypothetical protein
VAHGHEEVASDGKKRVTPLLSLALSFHGFAEELVDSGLISASLRSSQASTSASTRIVTGFWMGR